MCRTSSSHRAGRQAGRAEAKARQGPAPPQAHRRSGPASRTTPPTAQRAGGGSAAASNVSREATNAAPLPASSPAHPTTEGEEGRKERLQAALREAAAHPRLRRAVTPDPDPGEAEVVGQAGVPDHKVQLHRGLEGACPAGAAFADLQRKEAAGALGRLLPPLAWRAAGRAAHTGHPPCSGLPQRAQPRFVVTAACLEESLQGNPRVTHPRQTNQLSRPAGSLWDTAGS